MLSLRNLSHLFVASTLILGGSVAFAATNPVSYTLTPSSGLPSTTTVGSSYVVQYLLRNRLPVSVTISNVSRNFKGGTFSVNDSCSGVTLGANATCPVSISFKPTRAGAASMQLALHYDKNIVYLPTLSTTAQSGDTANISGAVAEPLPAETHVGTGYPVTFRFTNTSSSSVTASQVTLTGDTGAFVESSNDCADPITPTNYCQVSGTFTPFESGRAAIGVTYSYDDGTKSVLLSTQTHAQSTGDCASVTGTIPLELPTQTYSYADNVVEFKFTNHCDNASASLGTVSLIAPGTLIQAESKDKKTSRHSHKAQVASSVSSILTKGVDNCSGQTLGAGRSCTVTASLVPGANLGATHVEAKLSYTESEKSKIATATTTSTIHANNTTNRVITVINQCSMPVWMTFNAGAVGSPGCNLSGSQHVACPTGTTCNTSAAGGNGQCYWSNPTQGVTSNGKLAADVPNQAPATMNITIPENNGDHVPGVMIYNAGILPRLGCSGSGATLSCKINNCTTGSDGLCLPGDGPATAPVAFNAVEFTFNKTGGDGIYDHEVIDGMAVPLEMKGRGPASSGTAPYNSCNATGAIIQPSTGSATTQLGGCNYQFSLPSGAPGDITDYRYVYLTNPNNPTYCDTNADCTVSGQVCGLALGGDNKIDKACGLLEGYTSINKGVCSQGEAKFGRSKSLMSPSFGRSIYHTTFECDDSHGSGSQAYTNTNLYACSGSVLGQASCYNGASPCCGCIDWWKASGGSLIVPTSTISCDGNTNAVWNSVAQPTVQVFKAACPTSYAYQYDDKSSSFTCSVKNSSEQVVTNYQVTFCPGGKEISTITQ